MAELSESISLLVGVDNPKWRRNKNDKAPPQDFAAVVDSAAFCSNEHAIEALIVLAKQSGLEEQCVFHRTGHSDHPAWRVRLRSDGSPVTHIHMQDKTIMVEFPNIDAGDLRAQFASGWRTHGSENGQRGWPVVNLESVRQAERFAPVMQAQLSYYTKGMVAQATSTRAGMVWTEPELYALVGAYVTMLRQQQTGITPDRTLVENELLSGALAGRPAIRPKLQDVSAVVAELGHTPLVGYKPWPDAHVGQRTVIVRLLAEHGLVSAELLSPTEDERTLDLRVAELLEHPVAQPIGQAVPEKVPTTGDRFKRDPAVKAFVLQHAAGMCELCGEEAPFETPLGVPFLEVHHVVALADNGSDTVENAAALCPNCHRRCHLSSDAAQCAEILYAEVDRLERE